MMSVSATSIASCTPSTANWAGQKSRFWPGGVRAINPECEVNPRQAFFTSGNAGEILATPYAYVLDAIDSPSQKSLLIALCQQQGIPVITTGGAAGRRDPTAVRVMDLAFTSHDRLTMYVRRLLRSRFGFPRQGSPFQVECVCSTEMPLFPKDDGTVCTARPIGGDLRLDCQSGFGTASFVTGTFGFVAAARIIQAIAVPNPDKLAKENNGKALALSKTLNN